MEELVDFYHECGRQDQNETFNDANDEITILELFRSAPLDVVQYRALKLSGSRKVAWLASDNSPSNESVMLQLLQITLKSNSYSNHRHLDISKDDYNAVLRKFDLQRRIGYSTSATQIFNHSSESSQDRVCSYTTIHIDDYATLLHKYDDSLQLTQGIYWAREMILPFLGKAVLHQRALADRPFFLNLCAALSFGAVLDSRLSIVSDEMARIERRTGFKVWDLGRYEPAQGDSYALSATASGYATSLAANKRLNQLIASILNSYGETNAGPTQGPMENHDPHDKDLIARVKLLLQRNETQSILIEFLTARLQNQRTALFNLITQTDTRITISIAKDSRLIASASKHDSSSMKVLAAVTTIFLPGTFISSLFSTSMFNWQAEADNLVVNKRFWIYWAFTLPLTVLTIIAWLTWTNIEESVTREKDVKAWKEPVGDDNSTV